MAHRWRPINIDGTPARLLSPATFYAA
jgi:hypothetical protein